MALSKRQEGRLRAMNQRLYPGKLRVLKSGSIQLDYRREGKVIRKVLGEESALEEAYERALLLRREADSMPLITERKMSLADFYRQWSLAHYPELELKTVDSYQYNWSKLPDWVKELDLGAITKKKAEEAVNEVTTNGARKNTGIFLALLLNAAVQAGIIVKNPYKPSYKKQKKVVPVFTPDQIEALCKAVTDSARPAVALAVYSGLRKGEVMALTAGDIDLESRLIYIRKRRIKIYGEEGVDEVLDGTKTGAPRVVPLPMDAIQFIEPAIKGKKKSEPLYKVWRQDLYHRLKTACTRLDLPRVGMHDLRHICASRLMMTGGPALAQAILGHQDISTTVDTYGHLTPAYLASQMELAFLKQETIDKARLLSTELSESDDEQVRELARLTEQLCDYLKVRKETGLNGAGAH